ncbi:MAG TPA: tetratricopeptide repeat protein [Polyangia bacterium]|nr:tetratricopeptide repeat protein [Polyangia bacterium]
MICWAGPARGDSVTEAFKKGGEAYYRGDYAAAVSAYERVAALGVVHEDLFYNLGNAYYRAGRLGPAIYNYERALQLDPDQDDAAYNLRIARQVAERRAADKIEGADRDPLWMRATSAFTVAMLTWTFLALYVGIFSLFIALRFIPSGGTRAGLVAVSPFLALATLAAGLLLGGRIYLAERVHQAIVLPDAVAVKEGPDPNYKTTFDVHAGLKLRLTDRDQDWLKVRLANGLEGWVRDSDVGRL